MISIIVPVYNMEKYLKKCVDSLLAQSYSNIEIILVNDGSKDESAKICEEYAIKDFRVKTLHKLNGGVSSARNEGIKVAKGKYIAFVDPDDYVHENMYEIMRENIEKFNVDMVFCGYHIVDENDNIIRSITPNKEGLCDNSVAIEQVVGNSKEAFYGTSPWNKLIRRECIGDVMYNTQISVSEDALFNLEVLYNCKSIFMNPMPLYFYLHREGSAFHTSGITKQRIDHIRAWNLIKNKFVHNSFVKNRANYILFNDGRKLMLDAYILKEKELYRELQNLILPGKKTWYSDSNVTIQTIIKSEVMLLLMRLNVSVNIMKKICLIHNKRI